MKVVSRSKARDLGLRYYQLATPCVHGHAAPRFTSNRACVVCSAAKSKIWYADPSNKEKIYQKDRRRASLYPEKVKETQAQWRRRNPELCLKITQAWRAKNTERFKEGQRKWWSENKSKRLAYGSAYRSRKRGNGGSHTPEDVSDILKMQRGKCAICRVQLGDKYHVDHIIALKNGGSNDRRNLQVLCQPCNNSKSSRCPIKHMQSLGMLL